MHNKHESGRMQAEAIWRAGVEAVQPGYCIPQELSLSEESVRGWSPDRSYLIVGGGKAGAAMAQATEAFLLDKGIPPDRITGWVNVPEGSKPTRLQCVHLHPARPVGYNFPTPDAVRGTEQMLKLIDDAPDDALILCLISGGGSAILCAPVPGVPLDDKVEVSKQLSAAGATITELNAVRKHLSLFKGGQLAQRCFRPGTSSKKQLLSLIISDVIGDPLDVIASGPTVLDPMTFYEALAVLQNKGVTDKAPRSVIEYLQAGERGEHEETLKQLPADKSQLLHCLVASNQKAINAAARMAESFGYEVVEYSDKREHDTIHLATYFADQITSYAGLNPICLISGGESTVKLPPNHGKGGRNQSFALACLSQLQLLSDGDDTQLQGITILCAGTDGEDGPTDAAGAFADLGIVQAAREQGLSMEGALKRQDAYPFFEATDGLFKTGLTETNVMDLRVVLINSQR
jgi:glycerate 2-kinase